MGGNEVTKQARKKLVKIFRAEKETRKAKLVKCYHPSNQEHVVLDDVKYNPG